MKDLMYFQYTTQLNIIYYSTDHDRGLYFGNSWYVTTFLIRSFCEDHQTPSETGPEFPLLYFTVFVSHLCVCVCVNHVNLVLVFHMISLPS